ncbi:P-loop containing nucleoside triphosphate hydrolase protein [Saccharata proteae CBS 121410]|uniref:Origin recognition complex subunit 1 n=1 Tax=Saccharata proteae CBS 121410 TaxID=1314787 RepID=A0A6A5YDH1_9PEZI|nr:P-loop containing nucleoside triphosphate hydrolase protein [Saccharata proteae CBS 121410]
MAPSRKQTKTERARQWIKSGGVLREDSDDELGLDDHPWEWIYDDEDGEEPRGNNGAQPGEEIATRKRQAPSQKRQIVGARMGQFQCRIGDTVFLKAEGNEAWVGLVCDLFEDHDQEDEQDVKMATFMWFSTPKEIRNKAKKRTDFFENELYITTNFDDNPLTTINGRAVVVSASTFFTKHPTGRVDRRSKDYGKIFICRRGCNTRTATYTDEFVWEDIYSGREDLIPLMDRIKAQTKATRKRQASKRAEEDEMDGFVIGDENDDGEPRTPKKRRKLNDATTPTSKRKDLTPRKFLTPTHKRIVVKKPLEFTPLGTRVLSPNVKSSPFQVARNNLHVSSVPATLPCREEEFSTVYAHLEAAITDGSGSCIYIAGTPGTGKTATVREVVAQLNASVQAEELDDFIFVEINGMKVTDPHQSYSLLWEALRGDRVSPSQALELLEREFSSPSPRRVPCVVLMDELDQLVTKNQSVMYNFFNWPGLRHSRLIVLAVANTMDLPERTLSNKISSRLGLTRITFPGYTHNQLMAIIQARLDNVPGNVVDPDAVQFAARKVAAVSGDARRALDICRRAVEIAETQSLAADANADPSAPNTPSKTGRGTKEHTIAKKKPDIREAILGDVIEEAKRLGLMTELAPLQTYLLTDGNDRTDENAVSNTPSKRKQGKADADKAARVRGLGEAAVELAEAGIVALESRRGERVGRVRLGVGEEEVCLALRDDEASKGLGFRM